MKALLVLACVLVVAQALVAPACPTNGTTGIRIPNGQIQPFYKYSYEMNKSGSTGSVWILVDAPERLTQGLWVRGSSDASTALSADLHVKLTVNQVGQLSDPDWAVGTLTTGDFTAANTFGLPSTFANISLGDQIWLTFFPTCSACSSTVEFSIETAWYYPGSTTDYPDIKLLNNIRTMVFEQPQGTYTPFYTVVASPNMDFYTSVVFNNKAVTGSSEIVLYWSNGAAYNGTNATTFVDQYPSGDGVITGNYLTQRPFVANTSGTWYLTTFIKTGASVGEAQFTIKVGFNMVPCSGGSVLSISVFLALLPFLASLWN
jgi:hypothetical protein